MITPVEQTYRNPRGSAVPRYGLLSRLWRALKMAFVSFGLFLAFVALVECLQAYKILRDISPVLGWIFVVGLIALLATMSARFLVIMASRPPVLTPPAIPDLDNASSSHIRHYTRYISNVLDRLSDNPLVVVDGQKLQEHATQLRRRLKNRTAPQEILADIIDTVENVITPAVEPLDKMAKKKVTDCVRDTMLAVTVSPWRSVDLFVVLYRNGKMVLDVSAIYNGRPRFREQVEIATDVLKVVATVQFLNIGSKLMENLTSWIPVLGRFTDDIAQGIGAGLFTSVAGHATIDRCRAFHGWSESQIRSGMPENLRLFMVDIKGIVSDTIMPSLKGRIEAETPEEHRSTNLVEKAKAGIGDAIDSTCDVLDSCVRKPVTIGYRGVATTGSLLWGGAKRAGTGVGKSVIWTRRHGWTTSVKGIKVTGKVALWASKGIAHSGKSALRGTVKGSQVAGRSAKAAAKSAIGVARRSIRKRQD